VKCLIKVTGVSFAWSPEARLNLLIYDVGKDCTFCSEDIPHFKLVFYNPAGTCS
jgi:hypothetical protein